MIALTRQADDDRAAAHGELDGDRPDAAGRAGDGDNLARLRRHRVDTGVGRHRSDEQRAGNLPRNGVGLGGELIDGNRDELGVTGPCLGPATHGISDREGADVGAELLFQIIADRTERAALILTTNLPFSEWTQVIPNARLCKAVFDRITDHAHIIDTGHDSYRFRRTLEKRPKKG